MKIYRKKPNYLIFGSGLLFLLLLINLTTLVIVGLMFYKQSPLFGLGKSPATLSPVPANANNKFSNCQLLSDACASRDCAFYYLCSDFSNMKNCTVYDCDSKYGIIAELADGSFISKESAKPDKEKIYALVDRCKGKLEVKNTKCVKDKNEIDLSVTTAGECSIKGFMVDTGNKNYIAPSFEKNNDIYHLTLDSCDKFSEIIAVGEGGVSIR